MIGISGIAGSGKDLFCTLLLKHGIKGHRIALADQLKEELRPFILKKYNIDAINCSPQQKNQIRDLLVFYGGLKRFQTRGSYWTNIAQKKAESCKGVPIVTDVRYDDFENDEVSWLKSDNNGTLIHIRKYWEVDDLFERQRLYFDPPNEDEKRNDPKLASKADYLIEWPHIEDAKTKDIEEALLPFVKEFIKWYKERNKNVL
jgi:hypothetical protein